jgi:energy-coupling factor transport system ATP-binding protein
MISLENVYFQYGQHPPVFSGLNLEIRDSSWTVISGPDGSGKTTLGKLIKGLLKPQSGFVTIKPPEEIESMRIGYIGGDCSTSIIGITVVDDICFGMENIRITQTEMQDRLSTVISAVGLNGYENRLTYNLSGGERQKLALAGVLAMNAKILILDEAFSMLDWISRKKLRLLVQNLKKQLKLTVVEITNQSTDIATADMIVFLGSAGAVEFQGTIEKFLSCETAQRWIAPQGGINALLGLFPADLIDQVRKIVDKLNMG